MDKCGMPMQHVVLESYRVESVGGGGGMDKCGMTMQYTGDVHLKLVWR